MNFSTLCNRLFWDTVILYHATDDVDHIPTNPYQSGTIEARLFEKNWIDTVQWHLEDLIREPSIEPHAGMALKRRIDRSNQNRTDLVEMIDSYFLEKYAAATPSANATLNTESPAWAIDRLSILALKIYHMQVEAVRSDATAEHRATCQAKLDVLMEQRVDLSTAIDQLLSDMESGVKIMKVYRQMKMYNDPSLNPVLYAGKDGSGK